MIRAGPRAPPKPAPTAAGRGMLGRPCAERPGTPGARAGPGEPVVKLRTKIGLVVVDYARDGTAAGAFAPGEVDVMQGSGAADLEEGPSRQVT